MVIDFALPGVAHLADGGSTLPAPFGGEAPAVRRGRDG